MKIIGIISDTHGTLRKDILDFLSNVDEIWHAGDIGSLEIIDKLSNYKPSIFVYGNIDNAKIRLETKEYEIFIKEDLKVLMTHIGEIYSTNYNKILSIIEKENINLLITGHSHILKIYRNHKYNFLHINPGACGNYGVNNFITAVKITIDKEKISDVLVYEKPKSNF